MMGLNGKCGCPVKMPYNPCIIGVMGMFETTKGYSLLYLRPDFFLGVGDLLEGRLVGLERYL